MQWRSEYLKHLTTLKGAKTQNFTLFGIKLYEGFKSIKNLLIYACV